MPWIRSNRRIGAWVASFALALQLVLSFGHMHLESMGLASPAVASSAQSQGAGNDDAPPGGNRGEGALDICAICATLSLAGTALLPAIVSLVLALAQGQEWLADVQSALIPFTLQFAFQARAPPGLARI